MEAELASLVVSGATTLVGLMASDGREAVRTRVAALLRRGRTADATDVEAELERDRRELAAARREGDEAAVADLEAVWRGRLRLLLREVPDAARELGELVAWGDRARGTGAVRNHISGGEFHGTVVQTGDVEGGITFH